MLPVVPVLVVDIVFVFVSLSFLDGSIFFFMVCFLIVAVDDP